MQVWRNPLKGQIVLLVAVGATHLVKVFPFFLLWAERWRGLAAGQTQDRTKANHSPCS